MNLCLHLNLVYYVMHMHIIAHEVIIYMGIIILHINVYIYIYICTFIAMFTCATCI